MTTCRKCKFLNNVNQEIASDRGWCVLWSQWQKCNAPTCEYCEVKFSNSPHIEKRNNYRSNSRQFNYSYQR